MLIFAYFATILLLVMGLVALKKERKEIVDTRLSAVFQNDKGATQGLGEEDFKKLPFTNRILIPLWKQMKRNFQKKVSNEKNEKIEMKLLQAGSPLGMTAVEFRLVRILMLILLPVAFGGLALVSNNGMGNLILFLFLGLFLAVMIPTYYLKQKTTARNKQATKELPDFLDLVTVSIEAGLGFDSALSKVVAKRDGVLSREFQRCLEEMRLGKTRREALSGVRSRVDVTDVKSLIGSIIQAEQLGIGMVKILRVQSNEVRERRKQRAEEQAMKAPIKMLFPLVMFIFPCIFIVILGPAIIQIMETF